MTKGGLDDYTLYYEPTNGDRGKRWNLPKLKRPPVHYVYGRRVALHKFGTRTLYRTLDWARENLRRLK